MRIPSPNHVKHQLCVRLYKNGAASREKITSFFLTKNYQTTHAHELLRKMVYDGVLQRGLNEYDLTPKMRDHLELSMPIEDRVEAKVEASQPNNFKPLSSKYFLSLEARRPDALAPRDISFKTSGTLFSPLNRGEK